MMTSVNFAISLDTLALGLLLILLTSLKAKVITFSSPKYTQIVQNIPTGITFPSHQSKYQSMTPLSMQCMPGQE